MERMALKGSIDEFSLLDIFRLVGWAKKTGQIIVTSEDKEGRISFEEGLVCFAITPHNRVPIGPRLVNAGLVSQKELDEAVRAQQIGNNKEKLGEILTGMSLIKQDELEEFLQEQIQDALFEILYWTNGNYHFESSSDLGQENFGISFAVEYVIDSVEKRRAEWKKIKEAIPSTKMLVRIGESPGKEKQEIVLTPLEWRILYALREEKSVIDLREQCQLTLFKLCKTLTNMRTKRLVELTTASENESRKTAGLRLKGQRPEEEEREKREPNETDELEEPETATLEIIKEELQKELEKRPELKDDGPSAGGKYLTDFPEEKAKEAVNDNELPLEWSRYLKAPKRSKG
jgi:DNA-binding MarR family transcriptional regulator